MAHALSLPRGTASLPSRLRWRAWHILLTLALLALLACLLYGLDAGAGVLAALGGLWTRPDLLLLFVVTYTAAFALRAWAWRLLLPGGPTVGRLFGLLQVALLANHVFPTKVGEVIRVALLARAGTPMGAAAGSTALARLLDIAALCVLALLAGLLAGGRLDALLGGLLWPLAGLGGGILVGVLLVAGRLDRLWSRLPGRVARVIREARTAVATTSPLRLAGALALVLPSWLLEAGVLWAVAQAAGVPLAWSLAVAATAFTIAFQGFQVTPGGIGLYEASLTAGLALYGVDPATGLALAVTTHALKFAYAYALGLPCLLVESLLSGRGTGAPVRRARWLLGGVSLPTSPQRGEERSIPQPERAGEGALPTTDHRPLTTGALALTAAAVVALVASTPSFAWHTLVGGVVATTPLAVLAYCHYLPRALALLPGAVALLFVVLFGIPSPGAALLALLFVGGILAWRRLAAPVAALWAVLLVQAVVAGAEQPFGVALFGAGALAAVVLARQWWLGHRPLPPPGPPPTPLLAVVIPVHDEAATIGQVVAGVPRAALRARGLQVRVVVVDDGSADDSGAVARAAGADQVVRHSACRGLGAAVRTGLAVARDAGAGAVVYLDGDGEYDPRDIPTVIEPVLRGEADYVLGTRFPRAARVMRARRRWGNRAFTVLLSLLTGRWLKDGQTGYRAFSARALAAAEIVHDYNYAQVLTLDLLRKRLRLAQVPVAYQTRRKGVSFIRYGEYPRRVLPAIARELLAP